MLNPTVLLAIASLLSFGSVSAAPLAGTTVTTKSVANTSVTTKSVANTSVTTKPVANTLATTTTTIATTPTQAPSSTVNPTSEIGGTTSGTRGNTALLPHQTVEPAPEFINPPLWSQFQTGGAPEPIRGDGAGGYILGPENVPLSRQSPDFLVSPSTDAGTVGNSKWSMAVSHNRVQIGGWARQQNVNDMPLSTELAGVNMRLRANAYRELHWHTAAEWAYMIAGSARINAVDQNGKAYAANIYPGDLWYFPAGIPHSIQGLDDIADGCEFLLVFDSGDFSEDDTFLVTDWLAHVPKEVIARNFKVSQDDLQDIPSRQLWIFPGNNSESLDADLAIVKEAGEVPLPFSYALSQVNATQKEGGTVKIVDSTVFNASKTIALAEVTIEPGAMRELHWHPTQPEWTFFLAGNVRLTSYAASGNARTFDYGPGDIAVVPPSFGHYVENIGNDTVHYLEIFKTDVYGDVSLSQWLAFTPPSIVKSTLDVDDDFLSHLSKTKPVIVGPA